MKTGSRGEDGAGGGGRQRQKERTRDALLGAAKRIVARRGFARMTTRQVAEEAGVSAGTVFVHFPDVSALAEALLDEHIGAALAGAFRTLPRRGDVVDRLVHVAKKLFDSYDAEPELSRAYLSASLFRQDAHGPAAQRLDAFRAWVVGELARAGGAGGAGELAPDVAFFGFFSLYFGALVIGLRGQGDRKAQLALLEASLRRFFGIEVKR
jgi:AcrR family transcriptional regulator